MCLLSKNIRHKHNQNSAIRSSSHDDLIIGRARHNRQSHGKHNRERESDDQDPFKRRDIRQHGNGNQY